MLPSGLPEIVDDVEMLARFLFSSGHMNSTGVKASAFLPRKEDRETSVSRHGAIPADDLWNLAAVAANGRKVYGAGIIPTGKVRDTDLDVISGEPPPRHAAIRDWPWNDADPQKEKARHKELALVLARDSELVLVP